MTSRKTTRSAVRLLFIKCWQLVILVCCFPLWVYRAGLAQDAPSATMAVEPARDAVTIQSSINPTSYLIAGDEGAYRISIRPTATAPCFGAPARPIDAIVLLDTSASAGIPGAGSNLYRSTEIVRSLWAQADQPVYSSGEDRDGLRSRLGIVTVDIAVSGTEVNLRLPLTNTTSAIDAALDNLITGADSRFDSGINASAQYLLDTARPEAESVLIVILHDSFFALQDEVIAAAQRASADDIAVFLIGNRFNIPEQEQIEDEQALSLASSVNHVFLDPQAEDLRRLYVLASGSDETVAARGLVANSEIMPAGNASIIADGVTGELVSDNAARWRLAIVRREEEVEWGFRFRVGDGATGAVSVEAMIQGLDCNGFPFQIGSASTSTTVAVSTPTSLAREPSGVVATPSFESPVAGTDSPRWNIDGVFRWLISGIRLGPIVVPWWLLLLPLLLIILFLIYWLLRKPPVPRRGIEPVPPGPQPQQGPKIAGPSINANENLPGASEDSTARLRSALSQAHEIHGRIPVGVTGESRPKIATKWLTSRQGLPTQLPLGSFGRVFLWDSDTQSLETPIGLLLEEIGARLSDRSPVLAVYTSLPSGHVHIETDVKETVDAFTAISKSRYRTSVGASRVQFYWLHLYFVANPSKKQLLIEPTVEG